MARLAQIPLAILSSSILLAGPAAARNLFTPDFRLRPDRINVLMAADARMSPGLVSPAGDHRKLEVRNWTSPDQQFQWTVQVPETADYTVNVLLEHRSGSPVRLAVVGESSRLHFDAIHRAEPERYRWRRVAVPGTLHLRKGARPITLQTVEVRGGGNFELAVFSVELVLPATARRLESTARALRAGTAWFPAMKYGFMVHWTALSVPRRGERKRYADAVRDFDVEGFANQMQEGGAGFVVLVTAHAMQYLPAPIQALERILPGRTAPRDLIAELASALEKRGIRLMLYYHLGASSDPDWLKASGFWDTDTTTFFRNWQNIVAEAGARYGHRLAGWWFDDGTCNYYYRSAPWEALYRASKAGNPKRLVTFNRWLWPTATDFQDYDACEVCTDPSGNGWLPVGGSGHYLDGPAKGFQAAATLITEGDWVHEAKDSEIGPPRWTASQMRAYLRDFISRKNVPIFNLEIYQEGRVSPASIAVFREARKGL